MKKRQISQAIFNRFVLTRYDDIVNILTRSPCVYKEKGGCTERSQWADSSDGRASALQAEGHRFEPCSAYQF